MNLVRLLEERAAEHPDAPALIDAHKASDRVLSFGERNPNEQIHYVGTSVWYRWQ